MAAIEPSLRNDLLLPTVAQSPILLRAALAVE
jgi:hypothetical protein